MTFAQFQKRNLLLMAAPPSPNGRLHLGHIGGPFLKLDIIARHYKQNNCNAVILSGNDCFDSYVLFKALHEAKSPAEVTHHYHDLIATDLKNMDIQLDEFINPIESGTFSRYEYYNQRLLSDLEARKLFVNIEERFPYCPQLASFLPESFMMGTCANCQNEISGLTCEKCGMHFKPQEVLNFKSKIKVHELQFQNSTNIFLSVQPQQVLDYLYATNINEKYTDLIRHYFSLALPFTRLTIPGKWGVKAYFDDQVCYSFGMCFSYFLLQGERYSFITNTELNAFHKESNVIIVASFGKDNSIVYLVDAMSAALSHGNYKYFDKFLINEFYTINGEKFSTSRGTAIWVNDIIEKLNISSDIMRTYLAYKNSDNDEGDFVTSEFIKFNNKLVDIISYIINLLPSLSGFRPTSIPNALFNEFLNDLTRKNNSLCIENYNVKPAIDIVLEWLFKMPESDNNATYWWLKCLSILTYPIMPKLTLHIWICLGHTELPTIIKFLELTTPIAVTNLFSVGTKLSQASNLSVN